MKTAINSIIHFFDRLEDRVRARLSHRSIFYALIGGVCVIVFWRGIWHTSDILMQKGGFLGWMFYEPVTIIWTGIILLMTGLFVSSFIGERIVISGLKQEKKITDKTVDEIQEEESEMNRLEKKIDFMAREITEIKNELAKKK